MTARYVHEHGSYYLMDRGNIRLMTDQVSMAFSEENRALLKHGRPEDIQEWWKENRDRYSMLFGAISVATFPRGFPVEEINRILDFRRVDASQTARAALERLEGLWP